MFVRTSTAQPIQSKPGPRLATVAGANATALCRTGCNDPDAKQRAIKADLEGALCFLLKRLSTLSEGVCAAWPCAAGAALELEARPGASELRTHAIFKAETAKATLIVIRLCCAGTVAQAARPVESLVRGRQQLCIR